jgi:O-antigen biosynthesis protein WbqP
VTRVFDVLFAVFGLLFLLPVLLLLWLVGWFDNRSPLFRQERVGRHQRPFVLIKFRTMCRDAVSVPTHLADASSVTDFGRFLRRTKLDELPQLWNVLRGDMSLVGPRPCLFNQYELIEERAARGVFDARPGITGLAQVQRIDMSTPELLAETDATMLSSFRLRDYFRFIVLTILGKGAGDRVRG